MPAVGAKRQRLDPPHSRHRQRAVEMRKQCAAARGLVAQRGAERIRVDRDEQEIVRPGKMPRGGFANLLGGGKMDEAVREIDRRAGEGARARSASRHSALGKSCR